MMRTRHVVFGFKMTAVVTILLQEIFHLLSTVKSSYLMWIKFVMHIINDEESMHKVICRVQIKVSCRGSGYAPPSSCRVEDLLVIYFFTLIFFQQNQFFLSQFIFICVIWVNCPTFRQHRGKVTGLCFSLSGDQLYSSCSLGSLALYDASSDSYTLVRLLSNTVVRGEKRGPDMLRVSPDGRHLAFIGPSEFTVTVVDCRSLDEVCVS